MARYVELRRHTDNDDDVLSDVRVGLAFGPVLRGDYDVFVSSGAQRATQAAACFVAGYGRRVPAGVIVEPGLRSDVEDRWRAAYSKAGSGELDALRAADPELVADDSARLAAGLRRVFERLPEGGRALAVGHSPTNEAAVYGLTGEVVAPMGKGEGVVVVEDGDRFRVEPLPAEG